MPQTILAVLALMITVTLSLSTHQQLADQQHDMIANEVEVMATGIALQAMETIRSRDFDSWVAEHPGNTATTPSVFEAAGRWGGKAQCNAFNPPAGGSDCNDLDDFHDNPSTGGSSPAEIDFEMGASGEAMPFKLRVEVRYVDRTSTGIVPASGKTFHKEVKVFVQDNPASGKPILRNPIHLSRVFSYEPASPGRNGDNGHGNDEDGYDESNPGNSDGVSTSSS